MEDGSEEGKGMEQYWRTKRRMEGAEERVREMDEENKVWRDRSQWKKRESLKVGR